MNTKSNFFRQESHLFYLYNLALILLFAVSACGEGYHQNNAADSGRTGSAALNIRWHDTTKMEINDYSIKAATLDCQAGGVDNVVFEVYDNAGNNLATGGPWPCNNGSGKIDDIPIGNNRIFAALAEDSDNNIRYHGLTSGVTIVADQYTDNIFIDAYPFIPTLSSPTDGDQLDPNGFALSWQPLDNASQYLIQVAEDSAFENIVVDDTAGEDATYVPTTLLPSTQYYWKVYAVDRFTNIGAESEIRGFMTSDCAYTISLADNAFGAEGGAGEFNVSSSSATCTWVAVANNDWITLTTEATGSNTGTVGYSVAANTSSNERTGTIIVGGRTHTITQDGSDCDYAISPESDSFTFEGGSGTIQVTSSADDCPWEASSSVAWIVITSGQSGNGNGIVTYQVTANTTVAQRQGAITISGQSHTVTQGANVVDCAAQTQISTTGNTFDSESGTGNFQVTTPDSCTWTAASSETWVHITAGASGSGNGTVSYRIDANTTTTARTGTITVGEQTYTITQQSFDCNAAISIDPTNASFGMEGDRTHFSVYAPATCSWTATSNATWVQITLVVSEESGNGGEGTVVYGDGAVGYHVDDMSNSEESEREGTITVGGRTFTITQVRSN